MTAGEEAISAASAARTQLVSAAPLFVCSPALCDQWVVAGARAGIATGRRPQRLWRALVSAERRVGAAAGYSRSSASPTLRASL